MREVILTVVMCSITGDGCREDSHVRTGIEMRADAVATTNDSSVMPVIFHIVIETVLPMNRIFITLNPLLEAVHTLRHDYKG